LRDLTEEDLEYLDTVMHLPHKTNRKRDINVQDARRYLTKFVKDHHVFRTSDTKKLMGCITVYFESHPIEKELDGNGVPLWMVPYLPKQNHF